VPLLPFDGFAGKDEHRDGSPGNQMTKPGLASQARSPASGEPAPLLFLELRIRLWLKKAELQSVPFKAAPFSLTEISPPIPLCFRFAEGRAGFPMPADPRHAI
jgi:hypothetical protein